MRRSWATRWLPIGLVLVVILSGTAFSLSPHSAPTLGTGIRMVAVTEPRPFISGTLAPINTTLTVNASSVNLSSQFWGSTVNNEVHMFRGESDAVNGTPARVLVWPGAMAGEDYDPLTNTHYNTYDGTPTPALTNESQFVQMCKATHCIAIVQVPAEIDDPHYAEKIVNFTEVNLSFRPAYWMIGNEPELWGHWKIPWKYWPSQYSNGPDPAQFGNEVLAYVAAIRNVDNTTPILGLPASGCTCGYWTFAQWISGVLNVTGSKIQAVAFHEYPAGWLGTGDGSLLDFYGTIQGAASIPVRMIAARHAVQASCAGCNVSVFISELGAALSWSAYGQYAAGFSGALSIASQVTQAMDDNLTNVDLFATELNTTNSWFNPTGHARPDYALYTQIFDHLGTQAFSVNLSGLGHTGYGIDTVAPSDLGRNDLLVVNDNITHSISFSPQFAQSFGGVSVAAWSWNGSIHTTHGNNTVWVEPYTTNPVAQRFPEGLPGSYTLPPQSMVLFEAYPSGATYVNVAEKGVPTPTPWYASIGPRFYTTTDTNFTLFLPSGSYPVGSVGIPLPVGGRELIPSERLGLVGMPPVYVSGAFTNVTFSFAVQWRVNVTSFPANGGTVRPLVDWWNDSQPLHLTVVNQTPGYAFVGWSGWGPGSVNGSGRSITITPMGRVFEKARFVLGDEVDLIESGLPRGTNWTVTLHGFTTTTNSHTLRVYEPFGKYGFTVTSVPGYRTLPSNGGFTVNSSWSSVAVKFILITPPPPAFPVTFQESGLPGSTPVDITVRDLTQSTGFPSPQFSLLNGTYAYQVGYVPGYHPDVPLKTFVVQGGPMTVVIPFVPTTYPISWAAFGARQGMNWSVELNGQPMNATSAWVSASLTNGSYPYVVDLPSNFSVTPRTGVLVVDGAATILSLYMTLVEFPTLFQGTGLSSSTGWTVRLGSLTQAAAASRSSFMATNGTYTFDIHAPPGYYAVPSHGNLTVAGARLPLVIQFHLTSERPSAALIAALSQGAVSVSLWIGASVFAGFGTIRLLRRRTGEGR